MERVTLGYFKNSFSMEMDLTNVLKSERLSYGPRSKLFEQQLSTYIGVNHTILCSSGTAALVVALQALKLKYNWKDGDEVICPALTFVATINAVLHCGLTPILVDIDPDTYNIDPDLVQDAVTERTRCLLPVHLFGRPAPMRALVQIADLNELMIVEDCCEAFGATHNGQTVGGIGHVGCFSTYVGHHLVTGVGGFCTTDDADLSRIIRSLVNHGIDISELPDGDKYETSQLARKFRFSRIGHSFRITELEAAIGLVQLETISSELLQRRIHARFLSEHLKSNGALEILPIPDDGVHSYMVFPIVHRYKSNSDVINHLSQNDIESRLMMPLTNQPCYDFNEDDFPYAKRINRKGFYVGCHGGLDIKELDRIVKALLLI